MAKTPKELVISRHIQSVGPWTQLGQSVDLALAQHKDTVIDSMAEEIVALTARNKELEKTAERWKNYLLVIRRTASGALSEPF